MKKVLITLFILMMGITSFAQHTPATVYAYVDQIISCNGNHDGYIQAALPFNHPEYDHLKFQLTDSATNTVIINGHGGFFGLDKGIYTLTTFADGYTFNTVTGLEVLEPEPLAVEWFVMKRPAASTDSTGILGISVTGGTQELQPYLVTWINGWTAERLNDELNNFATSLEDLPYGTYQVEIEDDHGCYFISEFYFTED